MDVFKEGGLVKAGNRKVEATIPNKSAGSSPPTHPLTKQSISAAIFLKIYLFIKYTVFCLHMSLQMAPDLITDG